MRRHDSTPTPAADRTRRVALALAALALLGAVTAAGTAAAQSSDPTVRVGSATTTPDGTVTVGVVLTAAPDGLAGYYLEVSVATPDVARVESASYPDRFSLATDPSIDDDGATVTLEAADLEGAVEPGASNVTLATVEIRGVAPGETELVVEPRQFDADGGNAVGPAARAGTVTVTGSGESDTGSGTAAAAATAGSAADSSDGEAATGDPATTATSAPFSPVLALVALGALAVAARRRR